MPSTRRARIILNPVAGSDTAPDYALLIQSTVEREYETALTLTTGPGDAESAAREAVNDGCELVVVGGGDGTLNQALNGIASVDGGLDQVAIGVVPLGTGNDFATALGIPPDVPAAVEALIAGRERRVDLGSVGGRVFVNVSGGGYIAEVSESVTPQLKTIAGRLAYLVGGAQALVTYDPVRMTLRAEPGGERMGARIHAFAVCNSRLIGGGRLIAPHALIDDGLLDVCVIDAMAAVDFVPLLRRVAAGEHLDDPRVRYMRATSAIFDFDRVVKVNTDGEVFEAVRCEYRVLPRAARFRAPDQQPHPES